MKSRGAIQVELFIDNFLNSVPFSENHAPGFKKEMFKR